MGREEEPIVGGALTERGLCSSQRNGINGSEGHSLAFAPGRQGRGWVLGGLRTEWRLSVKKGLHKKKKKAYIYQGQGRKRRGPLERQEEPGPGK